MTKLDGISYQDIAKPEHNVLRQQVLAECHRIQSITYINGILTIYTATRVTTLQPLAVGDHKTIIFQSKDVEGNVVAFWVNIPHLRSLGKAIYHHRRNK